MWRECKAYTDNIDTFNSWCKTQNINSLTHAYAFWGVRGVEKIYYNFVYASKILVHLLWSAISPSISLTYQVLLMEKPLVFDPRGRSCVDPRKRFYLAYRSNCRLIYTQCVYIGQIAGCIFSAIIWPFSWFDIPLQCRLKHSGVLRIYPSEDGLLWYWPILWNASHEGLWGQAKVWHY